MPTAQNDSQKPACINAQGSHNNTANSAQDMVCRQLMRKPVMRSDRPAASISRVR